MSDPSHPNPISWKPFYLTLIISLQVLTDTHANRFGEPCYSNGDCDDTKYCNKRNVCDCPNFEKKRIVQFFDEESQSCRSVVGKSCTLDDRPPSFNCVPNAFCEPQDLGPRNWGICDCKEGYKEDYRHLCVPYVKEEESLEGQSGFSEGRSSSMEEVLREFPIGSKAMTDMNMNQENSIMGKAQKLDDDGNKHILVDQEVLDRFGTTSAGSNGLITQYTVIVLHLIVFTSIACLLM